MPGLVAINGVSYEFAEPLDIIIQENSVRIVATPRDERVNHCDKCGRFDIRSAPREAGSLEQAVANGWLKKTTPETAIKQNVALHLQ